MTSYPTLSQVEQASHEQLAYWYRFLPSPGTSRISSSEFKGNLDEEEKILNRIIERFKDLGGWNPTLSKRIGWGN